MKQKHPVFMRLANEAYSEGNYTVAVQYFNLAKTDHPKPAEVDILLANCEQYTVCRFFERIRFG